MRIPHLRWSVAMLLFLASVLNYVDRQTLSILIPTIQEDLGITDAQYGNVVSLFLVAYTFAYLLSGRIVDRIGTRLSMVAFIGWWSLANALTGLAQSAASLGVCRFFLGLGEAGGYTASPKAAAEWFPPADRGIAIGIYSMGGAIGATIAPAMVITIAAHFGWRGAFVATGALGLVFVALWLTLYRRPETHPWITDRERDYIASAQTSGDSDEPISEKTRWQKILTSRTVWVLMAARLVTDPVWYFFNFWFPKYLYTEQGFSQMDLAAMWRIFLAADLGFLCAGFAAGRLIRRGQTATQARLIVMGSCAALIPTAPLIVWAPSPGALFACAMIIAFAHAAWLTSITSYIVDIIPSRLLGTAFGFIAAGSALGGILMNNGVAWAVGSYSYAPCFLAMAFAHPLAFILIRLVLDRQPEAGLQLN